MAAPATKQSLPQPERAAPRTAAQAASEDEGLLPNFCRGAIVLNVFIVAQFLAVVITVLAPPLSGSALQDLVLISLFVHWIAFTSVCALCVAGPYLNRLPERRALPMAYLLLLCITWLVGECALWLLAYLDILSSAYPPWYAYFHGQNLIISAIVNALVLKYLMARHQLRIQTRATERARAETLRQKIRPHLLFNSMNIIASLTRRAPTRAETAIEDMADLFRVMLNDDDDLAPVHNEINIARKYLKLERLRLERRLKVNWATFGLPRSARTPALILQLLLEHVVHNAVEQMSGTGTIEIRVGFEEPDTLTIELGAPYPEEASGGAIDTTGLENIRLRLNDHYGESAEMNVDTSGGRIFVRITHPAFVQGERNANTSS